MRVVFVCTGNTCRSPMAEVIFRSLVEQRGLSQQFSVASAATSSEEIWNGIGNPIYPPARKELARHGISCEGKRAVQLTKSDYENYDYLICMDANNLRNMLRMLGGDPKGKISKLMDHTSRPGDVADPWYTGNFEVTYTDIVEGCEALLNELL